MEQIKLPGKLDTGPIFKLQGHFKGERYVALTPTLSSNP
jgi:hypothetical protein